MKDSDLCTLIPYSMYHIVMVGVSFVYFQGDLLSFSSKLRKLTREAASQTRSGGALVHYEP